MEFGVIDPGVHKDDAAVEFREKPDIITGHILQFFCEQGVGNGDHDQADGVDGFHCLENERNVVLADLSCVIQSRGID